MVRISDFGSGDVGSNPAWLAELFEKKALFCWISARIGLFYWKIMKFFVYFVVILGRLLRLIVGKFLGKV